MKILTLLVYLWLICLAIFTFGIIVGYIIEKHLEELNPIKKWWRRHIVAPDPYDNDWKNFNG